MDKESTRIVNVESVIPTIYRAYKENYKIVFGGTYFADKPLYYRKDFDDVNNDKGIAMYSIDLIDVNLAMGNQEEFLNGIMFHKFKKEIDGKNELLDFTNSKQYKIGDTGLQMDARTYFKNTYQIAKIAEMAEKDVSPSLYERLEDIRKKKKTIEEHLGTYYQEDEDDGQDSSDPAFNPEDAQVPESNKTKKRVITYIVNN